MSEALLSIRDVHYTHRLSGGVSVPALRGVALELQPGEIVGIVGESGCGKSTLARAVMGLLAPQKGEICYNGINVHHPQNRAEKRCLQQQRQMIFQNAALSLDPHFSVEEIICEPLRLAQLAPQQGSYREEAAYWLQQVGLDALFLSRRPQQLSGGQAQRVSIARALAARPRLLVADEPIAALDVSLQAQIVNLLRRLQREQSFGLLFIAHDLAMVRHLCHRVAVIYQGRLVEIAPTAELFLAPRHGYTKALLSAMPLPYPRQEKQRQPRYYEQPVSDGGVWHQASPQHYWLAEDGEVGE